MPKSASSPSPSRGERPSPKEGETADSPAARSSGAFDLEQVQRLIEMMDKNGLTEISLKRGDEHWRLRRGGTPMAAPMMMSPPPPMMHAPPVTPVANAPGSPKEDGLLTVKAPTVGTFYAAQSPEDPPFVTIGSKVSPQTTVCLIEAMKVFNPIPAEVSGTVEAVLVNSGDAVEFGQPLFKVRP